MQTLLDMIANKIDPIVEQWGLSDREAQIVELFLKDITSTKDISKELGISPITVRNHLEKIYKKSGCKNKSTLIVYILQKYMEDNSNLSLFYRSPRVLVVDDEDHICEALELSLDDKGIKVHTTTNPLEVESLIKMHQFDFIICDIKMPGLNGHELVKKLKETH
jgi:DNA-binding NarL/FixJ family response regulator